MEHEGRIKQRVARRIFAAVKAHPKRAGWGCIERMRSWGRCDPRWNGAHFEVFWDAVLPSGGVTTERAEIYGTLTQCSRGLEVDLNRPGGSWAVCPSHLGSEKHGD